MCQWMLRARSSEVDVEVGRTVRFLISVRVCCGEKKRE